MDPFLIGMKAIIGNHYTYQSPDNMVSRMYPVGGGIPQSAMQSADGAADRGINL
jgi:hypothetical protein